MEENEVRFRLQHIWTHVSWIPLPRHGWNPSIPSIHSFTHLIGRKKKGLIRLVPMLRKTIFMRVDSGRGNPQFRTGSHDSCGNLTAIGSQDFLKWWSDVEMIDLIFNHLGALQTLVAPHAGGLILLMVLTPDGDRREGS